jgi:hypothetical protein
LLSKNAFEFNLRRYNPEQMVAALAPGADPTTECALEAAKVPSSLNPKP